MTFQNNILYLSLHRICFFFVVYCAKVLKSFKTTDLYHIVIFYILCNFHFVTVVNIIQVKNELKSISTIVAGHKFDLRQP